MTLLLDKSEQLPTSAGNAVRPRGYGNIRGRSSLLQKRLQSGSIHRFDSGEHFRHQAEKMRQEHSQRVRVMTCSDE